VLAQLPAEDLQIHAAFNTGQIKEYVVDRILLHQEKSWKWSLKTFSPCNRIGCSDLSFKATHVLKLF